MSLIRKITIIMLEKATKKGGCINLSMHPPLRIFRELNEINKWVI